MQIFKILFIFLCLLPSVIFSQDKKIDSINKDALSEYKTLLLVAKQQRVVDSVAKVQLDDKLKGLKESDRLEKATLEKQLRTLQTKDSIRLVEKKIAIESRKLNSVGYPVTGFFKDTLFVIYNNSGGFSARERAQKVSERIHKMGSTYRPSTDSLTVVQNEYSVDLFNGEKIIISISEDDALWNDTTSSALAEKYKEIIHTTVQKYQSEIDVLTLLKNAGFAILILLGLFLVIYFTKKTFQWTENYLRNQENKLIKGVKFRNHELINAHQQVITLVALNFLVKWVFTGVVIFIAIPFVLDLFPWTRNFSDTFLGYIFSPIKKMALTLYQYLPNLITILIIIIIFRYILLALKNIKKEIEFGRIKMSGFYREWANPTYQITRILLFAFLIVVIFEYLPKSESPIFRGVSVFLGLLFTFGSAGSLSNLTAGIILTYMRLFKIGDRVKIGDAVGDVIETSLLVIRLRTSNNEIISIPNSTVMTSQTINYSKESQDEGLLLSTTMTIGYNVHWQDVHKALIEAADRSDMLLKEPKPFVLQKKLDDFYVVYEACVYTRKASSQSSVYSQYHGNVLDCFNEAASRSCRRTTVQTKMEILKPCLIAARFVKKNRRLSSLQKRKMRIILIKINKQIFQYVIPLDFNSFRKFKTVNKNPGLENSVFLIKEDFFLMHEMAGHLLRGHQLNF